MKFNVPESSERLVEVSDVSVGNVYKAKGGPKPVFWLVVSVSGTSVHALGLDKEGEICSTTSYGRHVFERRELVGRCGSIEAFQADIEWVGT